jgi:outer membrane protein assembly factor BamB/tetratricopeptide (TPR) repeat protein
MTPTLQESTLYVGSDYGLHAVAVEDGSERWAVETEPVVGSAPIVGDTVYFRTTDGGLHAHDATTGQQEWALGFDVEPWSTPTVHDGTVYVGSTGVGVHALSASDGEPQWTFNPGYRIRSSPAVVDETLYVVTYGGRVYAVDLQTQDVLWSTDVDGNVTSAVAVVDGTVYIGDNDGAVHALSADDGADEWTAEFQVAPSHSVSAPAVANGTVYLTDLNYIYAFSTDDGAEQWRFEVGSAGAPVVVDDVVYVGGDSLHALAADSGTVLGRFDTFADALSPIAVGGNVYVASYGRYGEQEGTLYALTGGTKAVITGQRQGRVGQEVTFSGRESTTTADRIVSYEWTFDGLFESNATGPEVTHTFWNSGEHTVELRVTDSQGRTGQTSMSVDLLKNSTFFAYKLIAAATGVGLVGIGSARWFWKRRQRRPDTTESGTDSIEESEISVDARLDTAEAARGDAEALDPTDDLEAAIDAYARATERYRTVLEEMPEDAERREDVTDTLASVESTLQGLREWRETESELVEALHTAESHFQSAIAAPTSDRVTIPRERYRQAREGYDRALDLYNELDDPPETLTVSPDVDISPPPETLSQYPGVTPAAMECLKELNVDTLSAVRNANKETIAELKSADAIHDKLSTRLVSLHHWLGDENLTLVGRDDLENRKELAAEGYRIHK